MVQAIKILRRGNWEAFLQPRFSAISFFTEVWSIHNIVLVSGGQHSDSVIRTVFQILSPYRFLQNIEYIVGFSVFFLFLYIL